MTGLWLVGHIVQISIDTTKWLDYDQLGIVQICIDTTKLLDYDQLGIVQICIDTT